MEYTNSQMAALIAEIIHSQRDRGILYRRLIDGIKIEPLAEEFDISVRQCKNIIYRCQSELFRHI